MATTGSSPRARVLVAVNEVLRSEGLLPWTDLRRIGKHREGEHEITGVARVVREFRDHYVVIVFTVIRPDGTTGEYAVRFSRPAAIVVPIIDGQVVFVKQHRLAIGKWTTELPRGWIRPELAGDPEATVRDLLSREVGEEWVQSLTLCWATAVIGDVPEDTSTDSLVVPVFLIAGESAVRLPRRSGVVKPVAYDWATVHRLEDDGVINDAHTLAALRKAERHVARAEPPGSPAGPLPRQ
ncbi:MAG: hypothetical protein Q7S02_05575 [bacterium]|nr:hypothetical protein [bacterium]